MQSKWQKILSESRFIPENQNLETLLFIKLQKRIMFINRIKLFSYLIISFISAISLFIYAKSLYVELANSSVYSYFNLIMGEDLSTLSVIFKDVIYALFESLPIMSMTLSFGILFVLMFSFNGILLSLRNGFVFKN